MLTTAQKLIVKNDIIAKQASGQPLFGVTSEPAIAAYYNAATSYMVWRSNTPAADVCNAIAWASLTPSDAPDTTQVYANRALQCQAKQINLQTLVQGRDSIASSKPNIRAGLQDALTGLPAGTAGAVIGAGWAAVKTAMARAATVAEQLLATGTGTASTPADLGYEGTLTDQDISDIIIGR